MASKPLAAVAAAAVLLAAAGCARPVETAATRPVAPPQVLRTGLIAAIRPAAVVLPPAAAGDVRAVILRAIAPAAPPPPSSGSAAAVEFIVRADGGATLSVVQPNPDHFRPGDRVVLTGEAPVRLLPLVRVAAAGG